MINVKGRHILRHHTLFATLILDADKALLLRQHIARWDPAPRLHQPGGSEMSTSGSQPFPENATEYLRSHLSSVEPCTTTEYFAVLLGRAIQATLVGDYGIGAALVVRYLDVELVSLARNTVISEYDPFGHAEANAIRYLRDFLRLDLVARGQNVLPWTDPLLVANSSHRIFVRPASPAAPVAESVIYTTLEPCPMCTVAILNSRIQDVIIATPDEPGGVLAPERLAKLPGIWPQLAASQHLRIRFADPQNDDDLDTYIPQSLSALLKRAFWDSKDICDAKLSKGVLFKPGTYTELKSLLGTEPKIPD
jgi:tRNA(Arg) A34 adenosine deaminase TadA